MKKGFTLIELLAVIAIIGIISLITVPVVSEVIRDSRQKTHNLQINILIDGAKKWGERNYDLIGEDTIYLTVNKLINTGFIEQEELIDPKTSEQMTGCVKVSYSELYDQYDYNYLEDCSSYLVKYNNGSIVNFNPETNTICSNPVSTTGTKSGCMKWYIFNDSIDEMEVSMILDHNTTPLAKWINVSDFIGLGGTSLDYSTTGNNTYGPATLKGILANDTSLWNKKLNARIITSSEIASLVDNDWNYKTATTGFTFDSDTPSNYAFLYDNLYDVDNHRGLNPDNTTYQNRYYELETKTYYNESNYTLGYWTLDTVFNSTTSSWVVTNEGLLTSSNVGVGNNYGVRPVITIPKSLLNN